MRREQLELWGEHVTAKYNIFTAALWMDELGVRMMPAKQHSQHTSNIAASLLGNKKKLHVAGAA